jgi:hypothetical protein
MGLPKEAGLLVNLWKIKSWLKFFGKGGQWMDMVKLDNG